MKTGTLRIAWISGLLVVLLAALLGWNLWSRRREPVAVSAPPPPETTPDAPTMEPPADLPPLESPEPEIVLEAGKYTVQVSSWRTRRRAQEDAQRYLARSFDAYVQEANVPSKGGTWYRVRVGRHATRGDARQLASRLTGMLESGFWLDFYHEGQ
jgi:cell division septation protein DedD